MDLHPRHTPRTLPSSPCQSIPELVIMPRARLSLFYGHWGSVSPRVLPLPFLCPRTQAQMEEQ